jgi:Uri superfamily endonuclease
LWHIDLLLGNNCETKIETAAVARQRPERNNGSTVGSGVSYVIRFEAILRDRPISVSDSGVEAGQNIST